METVQEHESASYKLRVEKTFQTRVLDGICLLLYLMEREGQNVGRFVLFAELAIELLDVSVRRKHHAHVPSNRYNDNDPSQWTPDHLGVVSYCFFFSYHGPPGQSRQRTIACTCACSLMSARGDSAASVPTSAFATWIIVVINDSDSCF